MKNEIGEKSFKVMPWLREVRARIHEETKDMSREERLRYFARRPKDPFLAELHDRRKAPAGNKAPAQATRKRGVAIPDE